MYNRPVFVYSLNQACQKSDWPLHKFECPALVAHAEKRGTTSESDEGSTEGNVGTVFVPSETVRALGRLVWLHSREKSDGSIGGQRKEFELLESHRDKLEPSSPQTISYTRLGHALSSYVSHGAPDTNKLLELRLGSAKDIVDLLSKAGALSNAHTLSTPSLTPIGVALSPVAALINHSCVPNCVVVFPKASETKKVPNEMLIIAIGKIPPGEEVQIPHTLGKQKILQERYFFKCHCPNCETTSLVKTPYVDSRRALRCASKSCEGFLPMPRLDDSKLKRTEVQCLQCNIVCTIEPPAIADAIRLGEEGLERAEELQFSDPERAFKYTSNLIPMVSRFFHPSAHPLLALSRLHLSLLISRLDLDRSILDEAIRAAARVAAGISAVLPAGHPVRAVTYAELGKLLAVDEYYPEGQEPPEPTSAQLDPKANLTWVAGDEMGIPKGFERLRLAHHTLMQARQELLIGFGHSEEGGAVGKEVTELARKIEQEVAIWRKAGGGKRPVSIS
ncbi:SET protein, partial [Rhizoctonia solani]